VKQPSPRAPKKAAPPYFRCDWDVADAVALQALDRGDASPDQQKRALSWIRNRAAMVGDLPFYPGEPDAQNFACGRQFVGKKIDVLLMVDPRKVPS
jgi:hypothetical protein